MTKRQELAKKIISESEFSQAWFARKLKITPQNLNYHLNEAPELDKDIYDNILKIIDKYSFERSIAASEEKGKQIDQVKIQSPLLLPIAATVPAGDKEIFYRENEFESLDYTPEHYFWLEIDHETGESMKPLLMPGDMCLCSANPKDKPKNQDLVGAYWGEGKGAVKLFSENPSMNIVSLYSYNQVYQPIIKKKSEVKTYRVVLIKKK